MSGYQGSALLPGKQHRDAKFFYQRRQDAQRSRPLDGQPRLIDVADPDRLVSAFDVLKRSNGEAPGPDGVTYRDISRRELYDIVRPLAKAIQKGTYRPAEGRHVQVPKTGNRGFRTLTLRNIMDRVVAKSLNEALVPYWEFKFLDGSHGFRPHRSNLTMLASLETVMRRQNAWVLVSDDIKGAFDHVNINEVMDDHRRHLNDAGLVNLVDVVLRGGNPLKQIGIDQGSPYMPTALNVHLHHRFDAHAHNLGAKQGFSTPWFRYADNIVVACQDVPEGKQALERASQLLNAVGLTLKGENNGQPVDLNSGGKVQLLGFTLTKHDNTLRHKIRPDAWEDLKESLLKTHEGNNPPALAHAAITGWIASYAPAFQSRHDRLTDSLLHLAAAMGHRELHPHAYYVAECAKALDRWHGLLTRYTGHGHGHHDNDRRLRLPHPGR